MSEANKPFKAPECGEELLSGPWSQSCTNPDCTRARIAAAMSGSTLLRKSKNAQPAPTVSTDGRERLVDALLEFHNEELPEMQERMAWVNGFINRISALLATPNPEGRTEADSRMVVISQIAEPVPFPFFQGEGAGLDTKPNQKCTCRTLPDGCVFRF